MKMAIQYWVSRGRPGKRRFVSPQGGYHGDTLHAMSVCDPVTGMHGLFADVLPQQVFVEPPQPAYGQPFESSHIENLHQTLAEQGDEIAAVIPQDEQLETQ